MNSMPKLTKTYYIKINEINGNPDESIESKWVELYLKQRFKNIKLDMILKTSYRAFF